MRSTSSNKDYSYMLNIWNIENNKPVQTQILENQIPDFYTKTNLKFNFLQEIFAWPYLLYSLSNVVTNLETGECHQLPFRNEDFIFSFDKMDQIKFNFQIVDACFSDNKLSILYFDHEKYMRIVEIDTKTFAIKRTLTFPERIMKGNPVLSYWKKDCLIGLTRDGKVIKIILSL